MSKLVKKSDVIIHGYKLHGPLSNANAGFAKWGFASKGGREFFIKEFLDPLYPSDDSPYDEESKEKIRGECQKYEEKKSKLYNEVNTFSDGNIVRVEEFFRFDSRYYITTQRINTEKIEIEGLSHSDDISKLRVCLALSHSLMRLHSAGIVHADLKPDNILLEKTKSGSVTAKIIDIDSSFFENAPPEEIVGDQVYFSPEAVLYMLGLSDSSTLSCKMDVFSLGLIFHQILAGSFPAFPPDTNYAFEASLDDKPIILNSSIPAQIRKTLFLMLQKDPQQRCSMAYVFHFLKKCLPSIKPSDEENNPSGATGKGRIFINGLSNTDHYTSVVDTPSAETHENKPTDGMSSAFHKPESLT